MNVGELLRERDRLLAVIEEAKTARTKLKQVNILIAMYGDAEHVELLNSGNGKSDGTKWTMGGHRLTGEPMDCELCGAGPFNGQRGLKAHTNRTHGDNKAKPKAKSA